MQQFYMLVDNPEIGRITFLENTCVDSGLQLPSQPILIQYDFSFIFDFAERKQGERREGSKLGEEERSAFTL